MAKVRIQLETSKQGVAIFPAGAIHPKQRLLDAKKALEGIVEKIEEALTPKEEVPATPAAPEAPAETTDQPTPDAAPAASENPAPQE